MKKRILALLMALVLTVSCLPPVALAEGTQATEANIQSVEQTQPQLPEKAEEEVAPALNAAHGAHTCEDCSNSSVEWTAWESGTDLPNATGHYYLTQNVVLDTSKAALANGKALTGATTNVVLCLNGQTVSSASRAYRVSDGAKLTVCDCTGNGVMKGGKSTGGVIGVFSDGASGCCVSVYDVTLEGVAGNTPAYGGAISVYHTNMTLLLKGVTLRNFTITGGSSDTERGGAAVYINAAGTSSLTMENCTVSSCTDKSASNSGAVRVVKATNTTFKNCTFTGNSNTGTGASAIMLSTTAVTMNGCTVTGNSCAKDNWVGAVYVNPSAPLTLTGKNVIKDNTANGAGKLNLVLNEVSVSQFLSFTNASAASEVYITAERDCTDPNKLIKLTAGDPAAFTYENSGAYYGYDKASSTFVLGHKHNDNYADISSAVWQSWSEKTSLPKSGYYYLTEDVDLATAVSLNTKDGQLAICLNGHTISSPDRIFRVSNGFKLTICDCGGTGILKAGASNGGAVGIFKDSSDTATRAAALTMRDVTVEGTEGKTPKQGGAISSTYPGATVKLTGVTLRNLTVNGTGTAATATAGGSAIYMYSTNSDAKLYMDGCTVTGCSDLGTDYTGALKLYKLGTVELKNCSFTGNSSAGNGGSAMVLSTVTNATMTGCTVTGNTNTSSSDWAGAVYLYDSAKLTLSGKNIIEGNTTKNGFASIDLMLQETTKDQEKQFLLFKDVDPDSKLNITAKRGTTDPNKMMDASGNTFTISFGGDTFSYDVAADKFTLDHKHTDGYAGVAGSVTWQPWEKVSGKYPTNGYFYLTGELNMDTRVDLNKSTDHLHLCLNGQTLTAQAASRIFRVSNGAKLTICDCTGNGVIKGGSAIGGIIAVFKDSADTATGCQITVCDVVMEGTAGNNPTYGGAILANATGVQLNIKNVTFRNFTIEKGTGGNTGGAAIYASGGSEASLYMENCTVTGCTDKSPDTTAAVRVINLGSAEFKDCAFTSNTNTGNGASALMLSSTAATMSGCTFSGNSSSTSWSGVVFVYDSATLTLTGKNTVDLALAETTKDQDKQFLFLENIDTASKITVKALRGTTDPNKMVGVTGSETFDITFGGKAYYYDVASDKLLPYHNHTDGYAGVAGSVTWLPWQKISGKYPTSGYYFLTGDVTIEDVRFIEIKNDDLHLCLNGHTITARAEGTDGKTNIFRLTGSGSLTICDCGAHTNNGTYSAGKLTGASMGAIFTMGTATGTVNIYDGIITGNTTNDSGAAVVVQNTCQLNIYGGEFTNNTATNNGGAIYIGNKATVTIQGGTFSGNTAPKDGGAIINYGALNLQGGKFTGNTASINGGAIHSGGVLNISGSPEITGNTVNGKPGNLYLTTGKSLALGTMGAGTAKIGISLAANTLPRTFSNDMGSADCTAYFFSDNADYEIVKQDNKLHMKAIFSHPHTGSYAGVADSVTWQPWTSKTSLPTSGHWVLTEDVTLNTRFAEIKNDDLYLCLNGHTVTARAEGTDGKTNIFRLTGSGSLTICDCTGSGKLTGASMGAIFTMGSATGTVNIYDGIFTGNASNDSGAVAVMQNTCRLNIYGGEFTNNTATNNGGAIYIGANATATVYGGTFTGNTAGKDGGAIVNTGTLNLQGGKFTGNTASTNGGAIHHKGKQLSISGNPEITGNTANGAENNLYLSVGKLLTLGDLAEDTAKIGISVSFASIPRFLSEDMGSKDHSAYFYSDDPYRAITAKENCLYIDHGSDHKHCHCAGQETDVCGHDKQAWGAWTDTTTLPQSGYWYLTEDVTVASADGVTVTGDLHLCLNGHTIDGDGHVILKIRSDDHDVVITDCQGSGEITNGSALNYGAIYLEKGSFTMYGGKLTNNRNTQTVEGGWGGGAIQARGQLTLVGVILEGNSSTTEGGAITLRGNGNARLEDCVFTGNTAKNGGAIYTTSKNDITIKDCTFEGNTASVNGGAIYARDSVITVESGSFTANRSESHGGAIYLSGATLNIQDGTVSRNTTGVQGGAIFAGECTVDGAGQPSAINISGGLITANDAPDGAAIAAIRKATIHMTGGRISENVASNAAGAVLLQTGSTMTVSGEDTLIIYNKSAGDGGAVYVSANSALIMDGGKVSANEAGGKGGGIYALGATLTVNGGHIYQNSAKEGGGVYANCTSDNTGTVFTLNGGNISANTSETDGGGVKLRGKNTVFTMTKGTIQKNTAKNGAGLVAIVQSQFNLEGGQITLNEAANNGAGIYMSTETVLTVTGGSITENTANMGAGVYLLGSTFHMEGGSISKNIAKSFGGAVYAEGGTMNLRDGKISENEAAQQGGALYGKRRDLADSSTVSVFNISGGLVTANKAADGAGMATIRATEINMTGGRISENEASNAAGGILLQTGSKMLLTGTGLVAKNTTEGSGGGIYVSSDSSLTLDGDGKITENVAAGSGGGVMLLGTTFTMNNGTIWGNQAKDGGGVYAKSGSRTDENGKTVTAGAHFLCKGGNVSTNSADDKGSGGGAVTLYGPETVFTLDGGYVQKNTAPNGGAVLAMVQSKVVVKSGTMYNNSAKRNAGAVYVSSTATMEMTGGKLTNNSAKTAGGAIYLLTSELNMTGGTIQYNTTENYGGGINGEGAVMNLKGGQITGNSAAKQGGGIYGKYRVQDGKETVTQINLSGVQLSKNTAKDGAGIATIRYTKVKMTGGSVSGNVAEMSAGGILLQTGSSMTLSGGSISNNVAKKGSAGGVYASTRCSFNMYGGAVSNNWAKATAGGVYLMYAPGNFTGGKIQGNKAETEAGGLYVRGSKATLDGTDILDNEAKNGGGISTVRYPNEKEGIDAQPELIIKSGRIAGNKATNGGGMILQSASETKMLGGSIENNYAKSYGGAVYVSMNHTFTVTGGKINTNESGGWGGGIYHLRGSNGHYENCELSYNKAASIGGGLIINGTEAQPSAVTMKKVQVVGNEAREGAGVRTQDRFQSFQAESCNFKDNKATSYAGGLMIFFGLKGVKIKDCLFENNEAGTGQGGGVYIMSALTDCEITGCTFKGNTAGTEGGAMWTQGGLLVKDCVFDDNHAGLEGGAIATDLFANTRVRHPVLYVEDCVISNNTSGTNGGGIYADTASYISVSDTQITGNTSKAEGGAMWIVDDSKLHNVTITGNRSGGEGYALYYHASEYDGLSYIRGTHTIGGEMIVKDNEGGDMYMGEQTGIAVSDKQLTGDTYMNIRLHSGYLTQLLRGAYNYEGGDTLYTVTAGNRSLTEPEVFATAQQNAEDGETGNGVVLSPAVWVGGGALVVAILAIALILLILGKKKKAAAGK